MTLDANSVRSVRKTLQILFLVTFPLIATACIDETRIVRVNPDGTGTIIERIVLSPAFIEKMNKDRGGFPIERPKIHELREAAPRYGAGVTFSSAVEIETNFGKGYEAYYEFTDVNRVALDQRIRNKPSGKGLTKFSMRPGDPAELVIHWPADDRIWVLGVHLHSIKKRRQSYIDTAQRRPADKRASIMDKMTEMLDFRSATYVEIVGDVIDSNATFLDGNYITLGRIADAEIIQNEEALSELMGWDRDPNAEETIEFLTRIPNQKIETKTEINVKFR